MPIEIRTQDDTLDEIVATDVDVHLEQMDDEHWWLRIYDGETATVVDLHSKRPITARWEQEDA